MALVFVRIRDADGPAAELKLSRDVLRVEPLPLAGAGKRTREGERSITG